MVDVMVTVGLGDGGGDLRGRIFWGGGVGGPADGLSGWRRG